MLSSLSRQSCHSCHAQWAKWSLLYFYTCKIQVQVYKFTRYKLQTERLQIQLIIWLWLWFDCDSDYYYTEYWVLVSTSSCNQSINQSINLSQSINQSRIINFRKLLTPWFLFQSGRETLAAPQRRSTWGRESKASSSCQQFHSKSKIVESKQSLFVSSFMWDWELNSIKKSKIDVNCKCCNCKIIWLGLFFNFQRDIMEASWQVCY